MRLARALLGDGFVPEGSVVEVRFEWSPGRREVPWTADRTAADVAILVETPAGRRHLACIETKYHEASQPPASPGTEDAVRRRRELSAGLFGNPGSLDVVRASELEQLWRDHLLALSCLDGPSGVDEARYLLLAPDGNPIWAPMAARYEALLAPGQQGTFGYLSIEDMLDRWGATCDWAAAFRVRYLDVEIT